MIMTEKRSIEVAFSTAIFDLFDKKDKIVVVIDILRASSAICTAFKNEVKELIPVGTIAEAKEYKSKGYLIACERDGMVLDFADFGNSPFNFTKELVEGKTIVYSTTNGTRAVQLAYETSYKVLIGSFVNFHAINKWVAEQDKDVLFLCAGWKGKFCLEDTLYAGAVAEFLLQTGKYNTQCDSTQAAVDLWTLAKEDIVSYIEKAAHITRLKVHGLDDVIPYCHTIDDVDVIPFYDGEIIKDLLK
jgi:2-phosphosulfolactate phosphatase